MAGPEQWQQTREGEYIDEIAPIDRINASAQGHSKQPRREYAYAPEPVRERIHLLLDRP
jgi:hypothetical protein